MRIGISSACLYPMLTEQAIELLGESGIKNTEVFINSTSELEHGFLRKLAEIKNRYGMNVVSVHPFSSVTEPFMIFAEYERRYKDALEEYKRYFEAMNILGADILVFHGDRVKSRFPELMYFERFDGLKRLGESFGVTVAQENVKRCKSSDAGFIKRMKQALPDVKFVLDIKQCVRSEVDPFELLDIMGKNLAHVHLSDNSEDSDCLPVGKGDFDVYKLFCKLCELGFSGAVLLELYKESYNGTEDLIESHRRTVEQYSLAQSGGNDLPSGFAEIIGNI